MIEIISFGWRDHPKGLHCTVTYDVRHMINPAGRRYAHKHRNYNGLHSSIAEFVLSDARAESILASAIYDAIRLWNSRHSGSIAFGCYAGRHRSVVLAEELFRRLQAKHIPCNVKHDALLLDP